VNRVTHPERLQPDPPAPRIWACGGGKGGVGKSVVTANLGVALARAGKRCILLDADLGGANLHTLFGISQPRTSLAALFSHQAAHLQELTVPTGIAGLELISGAQPLLHMANLPHAQKLKVLRQLAGLPADYLLLDLGAGSSFNVVDFFLAAKVQLLVVTPLPTAVENAYHFLKAGFFRQLKGVVRQAGLETEAAELLQERRAVGIRSPGELLAHLRDRFPRRGAQVVRAMACFAPQIVVNQVRYEEERKLGRQMALAASDYFGLPVAFLGSLPHEERVHSAIQNRKPVLEFHPQSGFSQGVREIGGRLQDAEERTDERNLAARRL
jgi:flagellar biosynthesis protein FlhG